jgi:large subunit ribosomal protein L36
LLDTVDPCRFAPYGAELRAGGSLHDVLSMRTSVMKIRHSIKSAKTRERNCLVVRRKRRLYVINKKQPRYKTRQG